MKKKFLSISLVVAMTAGMLSGCGSTSTDTSSSTVAATEDATTTATTEAAGAVSTSDGTTIRAYLASEPDYLDPALNSSVDGATLASNSFVGLFTIGDDNEPQNALCSDYTVSDDGLTYTFTLIDSKWSDGSDLTAHDFEYSWKRAASDETAADYAYLFDVFAKDENGDIEVTATDDNTLTCVLNAPCAYFLNLCAQPTFMPVPEASVEAADPDGTNPGAWASEAGFVSNGAYTLETWNHDESMVYVKNPYFYDADNVTVTTLEFMLTEDVDAAYAAYNSGDLDMIDDVPTDELATVMSQDDFINTTQLGTYFITFNVNSDMFAGMSSEDAATLREALGLLIDRDYIADTIVQTGVETANTFIPDGMSDGNGGIFTDDGYTYPDAEDNGYYSVDTDDYNANVEEAIELLESIGYEFDDSNVLSSSTPISFTYLINNTGAHQAIAESVQQDLAQVGIDMTIDSEDWNVFLEDRKNGNFDVARDGWIADYDDPVDMLEMWTSDSGNNNAQLGKDTTNTSAPDWTSFDSLVDQIKTTSDATERVDLMHQAEDMLMDTWSVIPLYFYNDIWMLKTNISGVYDTKFGTKYFMYAQFN